MSHTSSDTESKPTFRGIYVRIDGKIVAENLTGLMLQVDPHGNVAIDIQQYDPKWQAAEERRMQEVVDRLAS